MYTNGLLSLGNIHQIAKGGMNKKKKRVEKGGQDGDVESIVPTQPTPTQPAPTQPAPPVAARPAAAPPAAAPPAPTNSVVARQPLTTIEEGEEGAEMGAGPAAEAASRTEGAQGEAEPGNDITNQVRETKKNFKWVSFVINMLIIASFILGITNLMIYIMKKSKISNIKPENRYNQDLIEYKMAKLPHPIKNPYLVTYTFMGVIPFIVILLMIVYVIIISNSEEYSLTNFTSFIILIVLLAILLIIFYTVPYLGLLKELKRIRSRINVFEDYVYKNFYLDAAMLKDLYNKGNVPESTNAIIRKAIYTTFIVQNYKLNPQILSDNGKPNIDKLTKIAYTLHMYKFLNTDLVNDVDRSRYYKTEAMSVFDPRLILLPGNSRVFKIADYMRSNIPGNMDDTSSISNILATMNAILKLDSDKINNIKYDIKDQVNKTRSLAYNIQARSVRSKIDMLVVITLIIFVIVIASFVFFMMI